MNEPEDPQLLGGHDWVYDEDLGMSVCTGCGVAWDDPESADPCPNPVPDHTGPQ